MEVIETNTRRARFGRFPTQIRTICGLILIWIVSPGPALFGQDTSLTGDWRYTKNNKQETARLQAIDKATEGFGVLTRGMARKHLKKQCTPQETLQLKDEGETIELRSGSERIRLKPDGLARTIKRESGAARMTCKREENKLIVRAEADSAVRTMEFSVAENSGALSVRIELSSEKLDQPIRYELSYERSTTNSKTD